MLCDVLCFSMTMKCPAVSSADQGFRVVDGTHQIWKAQVSRRQVISVNEVGAGLDDVDMEDHVQLAGFGTGILQYLLCFSEFDDRDVTIGRQQAAHMVREVVHAPAVAKRKEKKRNRGVDISHGSVRKV